MNFKAIALPIETMCFLIIMLLAGLSFASAQDFEEAKEVGPKKYSGVMSDLVYEVTQNKMDDGQVELSLSLKENFSLDSKLKSALKKQWKHHAFLICSGKYSGKPALMRRGYYHGDGFDPETRKRTSYSVWGIGGIDGRVTCANK